MVAGYLCNFCEILACWRGVASVFLSLFAETKKYCSASNVKSKVGRAKKAHLHLQVDCGKSVR